MFLRKGAKQTTLHASSDKNLTFSIPKSKDEPVDKMRMIRNKMVEARRREENSQMKDAIMVRKQRPDAWNGHKLTHARDVDNTMVQDDLELIVVRADVEALYPSLTDVEVANLCYQAIMKSKIQFNNINFRKARLYIAINMSKTDQRISPLWRVLPRRTSGGGVRPGVTSSPENEEHWFFPRVELTEHEKRMITATVVKIMILVMMNTHIYTWDGETFLQTAGGPIGLRSTCAVARVVMNEWDARWMELCEQNNIKIGKKNRYMDDIRAFLKALREGWRWVDGSLCHTKEWELEDKASGKSSSRRSAEVLIAMMNDIFPFLRFTIELGEDFPDGKLPSLDTKVWVLNAWTILFEFFEKTMASNLMVEAGSALSLEVKLATLSEEVTRRLRNTSLEVNHSSRMEILEKACTKMMTSGHKESFVRKAVVRGIDAFRDKVERSQLDEGHPGFQPLYQKAGWKKDEKTKGKALKKGNWFKGELREDWKSKTRTVDKRAFLKDGPRRRKMNTRNTTNSTVSSFLVQREGYW